ncbi:Bulb-type lectin domain [Macleaya cordata]|uniref:Bulb-type lectin domain n=1 Tax=Macleaya cordata TaxID=56857 RepID=A0A200QXJ6_MACCD|nr:Bulb-type lectin domain [Macleaya cordata]
MSSSSSLLPSLFFFFIFYSSLTVIVQADVPSSKTFKYVNEDLSYFGLVEDNAVYRPLKLSNYPFRLCFYNSTPDAYILGLGMGNANLTSLMRWVWTANRARPVSENAKLIFGRNGNLVLVDANGRVAWQTRTANKGVVDIKLLPNGNLVLLDKKGGFVWQSFDYPIDTLLVAQSLRPVDNNKLVSGSYIRAQEGDGLLQNVTFNIAPDADGPDYANELRLEYLDTYHGTLSLFRLGSDGNIHIYTYYEKGQKDAWEVTYTEFTSSWYAGECLLPEKCGSLGICENSQCVACPTPKGLTGWSKDCKPMKLPSCNVASANVSYYKVGGVDHFMDTNNEGEGPMKIGECKKKCSKDC